MHGAQGDRQPGRDRAAQLSLGQDLEHLAFARGEHQKLRRAGRLDLVTVIADRRTASSRVRMLIRVPRLPDIPESPANWFGSAVAQRQAALELQVAAAPNRMAAFDPIGFSGRSTGGRSSVVLTDDVWAFVGTSH